MPWVEVFVVFFVSHEVGDYLLQTDLVRHEEHDEHLDPRHGRRTYLTGR